MLDKLEGGVFSTTHGDEITHVILVRHQWVRGSEREPVLVMTDNKKVYFDRNNKKRPLFSPQYWKIFPLYHPLQSLGIQGTRVSIS